MPRPISDPGATAQRKRAAAAKETATGPVHISRQFWLSWLAAVVMLAAGLLVAFSSGHPTATFRPSSDFDRFAAFYVIAQSLERLLEVFSRVIPPFGDDDATKADKAVVMSSLAFLIGVVFARATQLLFLEAIGWSHPSATIDVMVTGLVLSGGTTALHRLISRIQKPGANTKAPSKPAENG